MQVYFIVGKDTEATPHLVQARIQGLEYYIEHFQNQFLVLTNAGGNINNCVMLTDPANASQRQVVFYLSH